VGCILTGNPAEYGSDLLLFLTQKPIVLSGHRYAVYWIGQLFFPTLVFGMTVGRIFSLRRRGLTKGSITDVLLRDGVVYFAVIFVANLANVITFVAASQGIQQINAPFSEMITAVMICRLILNLRSDRRLDNVRKLSDFHDGTRKGASGKADAVSGTHTFFDSQPGAVSSATTGYEWEMEFESASVEMDSEEEEEGESENYNVAHVG